MTASSRGRAKRTGATFVVWGFLAIILVPLIWMLTASFRPTGEIVSGEALFLTQNPTLSNFGSALSGSTLRMVINSLIVSGGSTVIVLVLGSMAAYSLARGRYRGRELFGKVILLNYLFPSLMLVVPMFILFNKLGLSDSLAGLTIVYIALSLPFATWLLRAYFLAVPAELESAAAMDGASRVAAFVEIIIPQALPGILSVGIFTFVQSWNEFLMAFVFLSSPEQMTVPVGMNYYSSQHDIDWGPMMAFSVVATVPVVALFALSQRYLKSGVGLGALKG